MGQEEKKKCVRKKTDGQTQEKTGVEMQGERKMSCHWFHLLYYRTADLGTEINGRCPAFPCRSDSPSECSESQTGRTVTITPEEANQAEGST